MLPAPRKPTPVTICAAIRVGSSAGSVLSAGLVLGTGLIGKLREVQTVDEVAEDGETLFVDDCGLTLFLVAVDLVCLGDDAGRVHDVGRDEDRTLDADGQRDGV